MLQIVEKTGDKEEVLDLVDTPEMILVQMCDVIMRKWYLKDPDTQRHLQDIAGALKTIASKEVKDGVCNGQSNLYNRDMLKKYAAAVEDVVKQVNEAQEEELKINIPYLG